jgi:hypothetical protein
MSDLMAKIITNKISPLSNVDLALRLSLQSPDLSSFFPTFYEKLNVF